MRIITILIGNLYKALAHRPRYKFYAIKGIFQMLKLIIIGLGAIVGISILIGRSPVAIITALGASAAILMLVFKDTILGLCGIGTADCQQYAAPRRLDSYRKTRG